VPVGRRIDGHRNGLILSRGVESCGQESQAD
jgi:hypothetical protein